MLYCNLRNSGGGLIAGAPTGISSVDGPVHPHKQCGISRLGQYTTVSAQQHADGIHLPSPQASHQSGTGCDGMVLSAHAKQQLHLEQEADEVWKCLCWRWAVQCAELTQLQQHSSESQDSSADGQPVAEAPEAAAQYDCCTVHAPFAAMCGL